MPLHTVHAQLELAHSAFDEDGGTWLLTDLEHDLLHDIDLKDLEVTPIEVAPSSWGRAWTGVEINFTSDMPARTIQDRLETILNKHAPVDTLIGID